MLSILLVGSSLSPWTSVLSDAVQSIGKLRIIDPALLETGQPVEPPGLYIVDATYVDDTPALVRRIRRQECKARILVVTLLPSWECARALLKAGAVDYVKKSMDRRSVQETIRDACARMLPEI
jgi:DNA-binding response OmpR family regulator